MTFRHIIIMIEAYFFMLFCLPLPVVCVGNAVGLIACALLIVGTFYFDSLAELVVMLWNMNALSKAALVVFAVAAILTIAYLTVLSVKMLAAQRKAPPLDKPCTVMILGCRVKGTRPTRMLRRRLNAAYEYMRQNPQAVCIVSGGQGADEQISEAQAMREYLLSLGLDEKRIYFEDRSTSTYENLKYSQEIISARGLPENIAVATDGFHQYRAAMLAGRLGMDVSAVSASTEPRYAPTYWIREWFGITLYKIKR